jgi:hypothetical protein
MLLLFAFAFWDIARHALTKGRSSDAYFRVLCDHLTNWDVETLWRLSRVSERLGEH